MRNIFDTIGILSQANIMINIISLVGWTNVYVVLVTPCRNSSRLLRDNT